MENATKALMIAGGVLIALIIITMFILMFSRLSNIQEEQEEQTKIEQIAAFNEQFEAYNKKVMYGTDVITLINKVAENNKKNSKNIEYQIIITVNGIKMENSSRMVGTDQEKGLYKCTKVTYNNSGRVNKIEIENYNNEI